MTRSLLAIARDRLGIKLPDFLASKVDMKSIHWIKSSVFFSGTAAISKGSRRQSLALLDEKKVETETLCKNRGKQKRIRI
jgi:hypothetical protein